MVGTSEKGRKSAQSRGREDSKLGAKGSKWSGGRMQNKKGNEGLNRNR